MDVLSRILKRQISDDGNGDRDDNSYDGYWWYSPTAYAIKWAIIAAIFLAAILFFVGGHLHARRRMKRGLPPMAYHRWLISRRQKAAFVQQYPQYGPQLAFYRTAPQSRAPYGHGPAYQMGVYGAPPPAYHEPEFVPAYTPAVAASNKINPDQNYSYAVPPPGELSEPARVANLSGR